jgi:hypothetical protein
MLGTATHAAIEHNYRKKKESRVDLPLAEVQEFYSANFDYLKGRVLWERGEIPGKIKDDGVKMVELYHTEVAPRIVPDLVEERFTVKFDNCNLIFKGIIDLVTDTGFIVDHKTSSRTPNPETVHKDLQCTAYALGLRYATGRIETGIAFDYIVRAKVPKIIRIDTSRTQEDIDQLLRLLGQVTTSIREGRFYPNSCEQYCSAKMCSYWDCCEGGRKFDYGQPVR